MPDTMSFPAPARGHDGVAQAGWRCQQTQAARQFDVLHQRLVGKAARALEGQPGREHRLIAGGDAGQARAQIHHLGHHPQHAGATIDAHVETAPAGTALDGRLDQPVGAFGQAWFSAKLALVVLLTGYQGWVGSYGRKLANGQRDMADKQLRLMNEVPGILTALIVVLVIVRPF